jgi:hypothetical protein
MTTVYRKIADSQQEDDSPERRMRPSKKTLASIEYEKQFATFDSMDAKRAAASSSTASKAISAAAKSVLQDEYVTRPREVSVIPQSLAAAQTTAARSELRPSGKRMPAAPTIQQVFLC